MKVEIGRKSLEALLKIAEDADFDCEDCPLREECDEEETNPCETAINEARKALK